MSVKFLGHLVLEVRTRPRSQREGTSRWGRGETPGERFVGEKARGSWRGWNRAEPRGQEVPPPTGWRVPSPVSRPEPGPLGTGSGPRGGTGGGLTAGGGGGGAPHTEASCPRALRFPRGSEAGSGGGLGRRLPSEVNFSRTTARHRKNLVESRGRAAPEPLATRRRRKRRRKKRRRRRGAAERWRRRSRPPRRQ